MSLTPSPESSGLAHPRRPPTRAFLRQLEEHASALRRRAGVGPLERLDPRVLIEPLGLTVVTADDVAGMTPEERARVRRLTPRQWSGTGMPLPNGDLLVLLHPDQTPERARVTILEEVAHQYYGHRPTRITTLPNGLMGRTFDPLIEQEAYWTAAAALLPMKAVARAVYRGQTAAALAAEYGVSVELAEFRIKILGLWSHYSRRVA